MDADLDPSGIISGVDSTTLVKERLEDLRKLLAEDEETESGKQSEKRPKSGQSKQGSKEQVEKLKETKESQWKVFSDGLKLPSKLDLGTLELLDASMFYAPYFIVKLSKGKESRYLVWNRAGKEEDSIARELIRNVNFRELVESRSTSNYDP